MKATTILTALACALVLTAGLSACDKNETSDASTTSRNDTSSAADSGDSAGESASGDDSASKAEDSGEQESKVDDGNSADENSGAAAVTDENGVTKPSDGAAATTEAVTCPPVTDPKSQLEPVVGAWYVDVSEMENETYAHLFFFSDGKFTAYDTNGKQTSTGEVDFDAEANCYGLYKGDEQLALLYPDTDGTLRYGSTDGAAYTLFDVAEAEDAMVGKWNCEKKDAADACIEIDDKGNFKQLDAAGKVLRSGTVDYDGTKESGIFRFVFGTGDRDAFTLRFDSATKLRGNSCDYTKAG